MFTTRFISSAKIWLTVCLAVMVSFATVTPDIHPVEPEEIACQDDGRLVQISNEPSPEQPNKAPMIIMPTIAAVAISTRPGFISLR